MLDVEFLKPLHIGLVAISLAGFALRALWMLVNSPLLRARPTRIMPHIVDTLLLVTGIALAWVVGWSPLEHGWLAAKLLALVGYVVFGALALRHGRTRQQQIVALLLASLMAVYMLLVAVHKQALPLS